MNEIELDSMQHVGSPLMREVQLPLVIFFEPGGPPVLSLSDGFLAASQVSDAVGMHAEHVCGSLAGERKKAIPRNFVKWL